MTRLIGDTPMIRLYEIEKRFELKCRILAKCEYMNTGGSVKDRVAHAMLQDAKKRGMLEKGYTVAEATSGNTGVALAMLSAKYGYRAKIFMPESASHERISLIRAYGGEVILTDGELGMRGAIDEMNKWCIGKASIYIPDQFKNPVCVKCHYQTTAPEIWHDSDGDMDYFVCGVGTGATLIGVAKFLKQKGNAKIVALEPKSSAVLSGGAAGKHGIEGIGAGFVPRLYDAPLVDEIVSISEEEAVEMVRELAMHEGVLTGISSGANLAAAVKIGRKTHGQIVTLLSDRGERYFSRGIFHS